MKLLLIGGTAFLGRHLVAAAQARRHEVTIFHRGRHAVAMPGVQEILGDRNANLGKLSGHRWDAVLDTCGYLPQAVQAATQALREAADCYVFISSVAAYADFSQPNYRETAPLAVLSESQRTQAAQLDAKMDLTAAALADLYGPLKALCEWEVQQAFPGRALVVRPGVLVGPLDPTDRFTYWASRVARGGEVLAPGSPGRGVQLLDARDLAAWLIGMVERRVAGIYNAATPPATISFAELLGAMKAASGSDASFTWVSEAFLRKEKVADWSEMPLYLAESDQELSGFLAADVTRALAEQLTFRPLTDTIRDTLAWRATQPLALRAGIDATRERELLHKWHAHNALATN